LPYGTYHFHISFATSVSKTLGTLVKNKKLLEKRILKDFYCREAPQYVKVGFEFKKNWDPRFLLTSMFSKEFANDKNTVGMILTLSEMF
jgi:hypothetical protein